MFRKSSSVALSVLVLALAGCNTMQGLGKDIERGGEKLQQKAEQAK